MSADFSGMESYIIELPFGLVLEISGLGDILASPGYLIALFFASIGWVLIAWLCFKKASEKLIDFRKGLKQNWKWVVLAVDIPAMFIQSPKAVEQIFTQLSGALISCNIADKYWHGKEQKYFSFEVVSIEGYTQFLIRTEVEYRDLVEAAIYAQYAEAEITEVEDYVTAFPDKFPDPDYDAFGVEFKLAQDEAYPIRTYPSFEHNISKDQIFSDPMAGILENFSRIGRGENLWLQIVVEPVTNDWKEAGIELVKSIIENKKPEVKLPLLFRVMTVPLNLLRTIVSEVVGTSGGESKGDDKKEEKPKTLSDLTPGKRATVEAIEEKISKIGFKSKINVLYVARRATFSPSRCIDGLIGAVNQFHIVGSNAIVPAAVTAAEYDKSGAKSNALKSSFMSMYKKRKSKGTEKPYILNIEELATIWHFPLPNVRTPLVQKAGAKRAEPPLGLPVELFEEPLKRIGGKPPEAPSKKEPPAPPPAPLMYG